MNEFNEHPDWNQLATLVDRGSDGVPAELLEHLAACPECMAAWSAAVEERDREMAGIAVLTPRPTRIVGRRRSHRELLWGAGSLAAAALLLVLLLPRTGSHPDVAGSDLQVLQRMSELSHSGLVYPRVTQLGPSTGPEYRAGGHTGRTVDVSPWVVRFAADPADSVAAFWLAAGHLGNGQLDLAEDVLRRALKRTPLVRELRQLAAIVAYQRNDLDAATRQLQALLRDHPADRLAAFNLAVIGYESGQRAEVRTVLEDVAGDSGQPVLQMRSQQILQQMDSR